MTSVSLRAYYRQIEEWIDQGLYNQAILHCRHILNIYPKCLDTYRLLGKAFLESQKFGDANDIFQRILSSLPDDFVSHVGMSIIREDESNLNEAIWHMERAFEIQPSNNAIQGELRRLYGRRDGIEPVKVNLNRSALARMYLKGNLHSQAIAEIRMALAEDPQRPDLEVLLAKAYFQTKQIPEAKAIASQLLAKLPYCYEALFLLWQISLMEGKEKDAERYLGKLAELDPYAAHLNKNVASTEFVPDTSVLLEKLDTSTQSVAQNISQPDWAASLGVQISPEEEQIEASLPDWIKEQSATPTELIEPEVVQASEMLFEGEEVFSENAASPDIPDWMRELGWEEGKPEEEQTAGIPEIPALPEEEPHELLAGDIPDWLKEISPVDETELSPFEPNLAESLLSLEETPPSEGDSIATWLAAIEAEKEGLEEISPPEVEELPDWVNELNNKSHLTADILPSETNWSDTSLSEAIPPETPLPIVPDSSQVLQPPTSPEKLPSWLSEEEPLPAADQLPDWLLASYEEEESEESSPSFTEPPISEEDTKPVKLQPEEEPPQEPQATIETPFPALGDEDAFAWLESLAAKQGAQEALLLSAEERKEEPPEWIREYLDSKPDTPEYATPVSEEAPLAEISEFADEEFLQQGLEIPEHTLVTDEQAETEELPEWLRAELEKEGQAEVAAVKDEEIEIPDWITSATSEEETKEWIQEYPSESPSELLTVEEETPASISPEILIPSADWTESQASLLAVSESPEETPTEIPFTEQIYPIQPALTEEEKFSPSVELGEFPRSDLQLLEEARRALSAGVIEQALDKYQTLVKGRVELDRVIQDLSNALYQYPMEVKMWILLGDAYLRKDLFSEALDAYNKAEELLR